MVQCDVMINKEVGPVGVSVLFVERRLTLKMPESIMIITKVYKTTFFNVDIFGCYRITQYQHVFRKVCFTIIGS